MPDALHLVKVVLPAESLVVLARRRRMPLRAVDDGYLAHCFLRELWQDQAPAPFVVRGRGRHMEVWGYTTASADRLLRQAQERHGSRLPAFLADPNGMASRPVPRLEAGRCVGFHLRACPVVRLSGGREGHRAGAEIDAFLARCFQEGPDKEVSREEVYLKWLRDRLGPPQTTGAEVEGLKVAAVIRERLVRRTHETERKAVCLDRPDVRFEGLLRVVAPDTFVALLARGIGRHRAFGFGALFLVPPGTAYDS